MMKMSILAGALSCAVFAAPAGAQLVPDLSGTWEGSWSCKIFNGAKDTESNKNSTLQITQAGTTFAVDMDSGGFHWNGALIPDAKNTADKAGKGEVVLIQCGTDNLPLVGPEGEIFRASVKTKLNSPRATLTGASIFDSGSARHLVGTCKYTYKRTSLTTSTTIGACL